MKTKAFFAVGDCIRANRTGRLGRVTGVQWVEADADYYVTIVYNGGEIENDSEFATRQAVTRLPPRK